MSEVELDRLIDNLSDDLQKGRHVSRFEEHHYYTKEYNKSTSDRKIATSPIISKENTEAKTWYKQWCNELNNITNETNNIRNVTPILKRTNVGDIDSKFESNNILNHWDTSGSVSPNYRSLSRERERIIYPKEKSVQIGKVTEMIERQDYYKHRNAHHGKPLPGENAFMGSSWPYGLNYIGDAHKPKKRDTRDETPVMVRSLSRSSMSPSTSPGELRRARSVPPDSVEKPIEKKHLKSATSVPLSPLPDYMKKLRHIVVSQVPVPVPPKFGTLTYGGRWADVADSPSIDGPPCILCHKPITEKRCITHENCNYHCWHFVCSFCFKTLKENDFMMAADNKPYCNNCFKRMFP